MVSFSFYGFFFWILKLLFEKNFAIDCTLVGLDAFFVLSCSLGTFKILKGTLAGFWGFLESKILSGPLFHGSEKVPALTLPTSKKSPSPHIIHLYIYFKLSGLIKFNEV